MNSSQSLPSKSQPPTSQLPSIPSLPQICKTQHNLFTRYSSSQNYFHSTKITQIIKQKPTSSNITFQDIEYLLDQQQYLKRQYYTDEYNKKLCTFKQYYYYHQDCPRIYGDRGIAQVYQKWHQRKRDYVYKKLKFMYNQTYTSMDSSQRTVQEQGNNMENVTHFLLDISEYNPYSKKYYLRVQARQQKQKEKQKEKENNKKLQNHNDSAQIYQNFNMDISRMLGKIINDVSILTIADSSQNKNEQSSISHMNTRSDRKLSINNNQFQIGQVYKNLNKSPSIKLNFFKKQKQQIQFQQAQPILKTNNNLDKKQSQKINNNQQKPTDYVYIDTQQSQNKKYNNNSIAKHKKQISQSSSNSNSNNMNNNNEFLSTHLLTNPILQLNKQKTRSILLMSTLGTSTNIKNTLLINNNNPLMNKNKIQINFTNNHNHNKFDHRQQDGITINNKNSIKNKQHNIIDRVDSFNILKSYKSLQKYDQKHQKHVSIDKIMKAKHSKNPSTSSSTKQKQYKNISNNNNNNINRQQLPSSIVTINSTKNLLSTQINNKLSLRQNSLNKLAHPHQQHQHKYDGYQNVQQFNDNNLVSHASVTNTTNVNVNTNNMINYNYKSQQILEQGVQHNNDYQGNSNIKVVKFIGKNQNTVSPKKNIRITVKNSNSAQKLLASNNINNINNK